MKTFWKRGEREEVMGEMLLGKSESEREEVEPALGSFGHHSFFEEYINEAEALYMKANSHRAVYFII
jgi:hypothetical protein